MKRVVTVAALAVAVAMMFVGRDVSAKSFAEVVGPVSVGAVREGATYDLPFILWGGEAATFQANGVALQTKPGSEFANMGWSFKLVPGDDFAEQVRRYASGATPFLRGTFHQIALASDVFARDPRLQPVFLVQESWSRGDHLPCVAGVKTVKDLRGKRIAIQEGGPHPGMLDDVLKTSGLGWDDVHVVWVKNITGPGSPAEALKSGQADCAFAVTPDMIGLTGGLDKVGTGAEGTVKGAHVVVSTLQLTRSIADLYAVRKDFYDRHQVELAKFAAAYLKAAETVVELQKNSRDLKYRALLTFMVNTWGTQVLPNTDEAHGLVQDCAFVGHPGNVAFFTDTKNPNGFAAFSKSGLDVAVKLGAKKRATFLAPTWNWNAAPFAGYLQHMGEAQRPKFDAEATAHEIAALQASGSLDDREIYSFTITFEPNQTDFSASKYSGEFDKAIALSRKYGGAVLAIRGHADPTKTLVALKDAGKEIGVLEQRGTQGNYQYFLSSRPLDLSRTKEIEEMILRGDFDRAQNANPREILTAAKNLSAERARAVRDAIAAYAQRKSAKIDPSQFQPQGVGVSEPIVPKPASMDDVKRNTRVEFALIRVSAEATRTSDFDY
ncbi:MAG: ABC transporter substrate-binding protein [Candidatus Uhrbacteria bacterium]